MRKSMKYLIAYYFLFMILFFPMSVLYNTIDHQILKDQLKNAVTNLLKENCNEEVTIYSVDIRNVWFSGTVWRVETNSKLLTNVSGQYKDNVVFTDYLGSAKVNEINKCNFDKHPQFVLDRMDKRFIENSNPMNVHNSNIIRIFLITIGLFLGVIIYAVIELIEGNKKSLEN
jgi:hypothetical protein